MHSACLLTWAFLNGGQWRIQEGLCIISHREPIGGKEGRISGCGGQRTVNNIKTHTQAED